MVPFTKGRIARKTNTTWGQCSRSRRPGLGDVPWFLLFLTVVQVSLGLERGVISLAAEAAEVITVVPEADIAS